MYNANSLQTHFEKIQTFPFDSISVPRAMAPASSEVRLYPFTLTTTLVPLKLVSHHHALPLLLDGHTSHLSLLSTQLIRPTPVDCQIPNESHGYVVCGRGQVSARETEYVGHVFFSGEVRKGEMEMEKWEAYEAKADALDGKSE
jgi:hypothetical protein